VACIGAPDDRLVEVVMAIIQVKQGQTMTEEEVLDFCKKVNLAKYKWPRKIVFDKVMRNPTGKLMKPQMRKNSQAAKRLSRTGLVGPFEGVRKGRGNSPSFFVAVAECFSVCFP